MMFLFEFEHGENERQKPRAEVAGFSRQRKYL
jgi:hypothetical protein